MFEIARAKLGLVVNGFAARAAAGPEVLVVNPRFEFKFAAGFDEEIYNFPPPIGQIRRDDAGSRVHEDTAKSGALEFFQLAVHFIFFDFVIENVKRSQARRGVTFHKTSLWTFPAQ